MTESVITIVRSATGQYGTFGTLLVDNLPFCLTLEDPDNHNTPNVSCIPAGEYDLIASHSKRFGAIYLYVKDVPGRSGIILGHVGNTLLDTNGCVLLGQIWGYKDSLPAVLNSQPIVDKFRRRYMHVRKARFVNAY